MESPAWTTLNRNLTTANQILFARARDRFCQARNTDDPIVKIDHLNKADEYARFGALQTMGYFYVAALYRSQAIDITDIANSELSTDDPVFQTTQPYAITAPGFVFNEVVQTGLYLAQSYYSRSTGSDDDPVARALAGVTVARKVMSVAERACDWTECRHYLEHFASYQATASCTYILQDAKSPDVRNVVDKQLSTIGKFFEHNNFANVRAQLPIPPDPLSQALAQSAEAAFRKNDLRPTLTGHRLN